MNNVSLKDRLSSKVPLIYKKNFKLPIFITVTIIVIVAILKAFDFVRKLKVSNDANYSMIFFATTFFIFTIIIIKNVKDIISLLFGQKGQDSLTHVAKKNNSN